MKDDLFGVLYDRVLNGLPVLGTPQGLAAELLEESGRPGDAADAAISLATVLGGATGFVFGLPGLLLTPVTLPANVVGAAAIQLHLAATIAAIGGHDTGDPATRLACLACLEKRIGRPGHNAPPEALAARTGIKLGERALRLVAEAATRGGGWAARRVALRGLGRRIPGLGGLIGAGSDGLMTRHVGACARDRFLGAPAAALPAEAGPATGSPPPSRS